MQLNVEQLIPVKNIPRKKETRWDSTSKNCQLLDFCKKKKKKNIFKIQVGNKIRE